MKLKKNSLLTLALASLISCSQEETIYSSGNEAIVFDNTFVENTTRAAYDGSYTTNSLSGFQVYGTITNKQGQTGNIFNNVNVNKNGNAWTYNVGTQYWIPGNGYSFAATVHGNEGSAISTEVNAYYMPTAIVVNDMSVQKDILYAANGPIAADATTWGETVSFTLQHLLAKVKFTVKNTIETNSGYSYKVNNLCIIDTEKNGIYNITNQAWGAAETPATYDLSFGNAVTTGTEAGAEADYIEFNGRKESNYERLLIPSNKQLNITFNCEIYKGNANEEYILISSEKRTITTTNKVNLEAGKAYNLIISLGNPGEEIKFTVTEVNGWINNNPGVETK